MIYALDAALAIGAILAWYFGILTVFWVNDAYYFSCMITLVGLAYYILGHFTVAWNKLGEATVINLGLAGTVCGFITMVYAGGDIYARLPGIMLALMTTMTGFLWGMILLYQRWFSGDRS